jgi:hypothetical protein
VAPDDRARTPVPHVAAGLSATVSAAARQRDTHVITGEDGSPRFSAERAGYRFTASGSEATGGGVLINSWPVVTPAKYLPLVIAGALAGMIAGWLLAAALAYRLRAARRRILPAVLIVLALAALMPRTSGIYGKVAGALRGETHVVVHSSLFYGQETGVSLPMVLFFTADLMFAVAALVAAWLLSRPDMRLAPVTAPVTPGAGG